MTKSAEQERAEFEAWWRGYTKSTKAPRFEGGAYIFPAANTAWNTWQAARRAKAVSQPQELEAPQVQRVPLSDAEIGDFWEGATGGHSFNDETRRDFVRSIEQAHGITQEK